MDAKSLVIVKPPYIVTIIHMSAGMICSAPLDHTPEWIWNCQGQAFALNITQAPQCFFVGGYFAMVSQQLMGIEYVWPIT